MNSERKTPRCLLALPVVLAAMLACSSPSPEPTDTAAEPTPERAITIDDKAETHLRAMSTYLEGLDVFACTADQAFGEEKVQLKMIARHPDRLWARTEGDRGSQDVYYDGATMKVAFHDEKAWASVEVPDNLDAMTDFLIEEYGTPIHMADLLAASPYESLVVEGTSGSYVALEETEAGSCHRLTFENEAVDWQLCVAAEGDPRPVHFSITYKNRPGAPQRSTTFTAWDGQPELKDDTFAFSAPEGYEEIPFVKTGGEDQ